MHSLPLNHTPTLRTGKSWCAHGCIPRCLWSNFGGKRSKCRQRSGENTSRVSTEYCNGTTEPELQNDSKGQRNIQGKSECFRSKNEVLDSGWVLKFCLLDILCIGNMLSCEYMCSRMWRLEFVVVWLRAYIRMYVHACTCAHVDICDKTTFTIPKYHTYLYIYTHIHTLYVCIYIRTVPDYVGVCIYTCMYVCVCIVYTYTCIHDIYRWYICVCTYIYIYKYMYMNQNESTGWIL
jgi:hypothetical protein